MAKLPVKVTPVEWLSADDAAKRLKRSKRRVNELAAGGRIERRYVDQGGRYGKQPEFAAGSIERYLTERESSERGEWSEPPTSPRSLPAPEKPKADVLGAVREAVEAFRQVELVRASYQRPEPPAEPVPWLSIDAAAAASGLPASYLLSLIKAEKLPALDVGPRPGGKWRIHRSDLKAVSARPSKGVD